MCLCPPLVDTPGEGWACDQCRCAPALSPAEGAAAAASSKQPIDQPISSADLKRVAALARHAAREAVSEVAREQRGAFAREVDEVAVSTDREV